MNKFLSKKTQLTAVALLGGAVTANAGPAYPGIIKSTQPDGTEISIRLHGDESFNWAETTDGYTLLHDAEGYWSFAQKSAEGDLTPSALRYRGESAVARTQGILPGLTFSQAQLKEANMKRAKRDASLQVDESFPSTGKNKLLMILVNYNDTEVTYPQEFFNAAMNVENFQSIGSFRDYYLQQSYGQLDVNTVVTRWVTVPYAKSYYGADGAINLIRDALVLLDDEINLADFDNDGDGILDGLAVIHQGPGKEYSGDNNDIWSHSSTIYGMSFDGIQVRRYTIEPEVLGSTGLMQPIGVICHEFGHNLGAPDFYDTDYSLSGGEFPGTGVWDLLGSGAWNGDYGTRPTGINMWQKIQFGWVDPVILNESTTVTGMKSADTTPIAYRMNTTIPGEYFILENRQQSGAFDQTLPGHGLLVYHANESAIRATVADNTLNVTYPQAMYTVCASAGQEPSSDPSSYGFVNTAEAPFPGTKNITAFNDNTFPSTKSTSGRFSYIGLSDIAEADGEISFTFNTGDAPKSPVNFTAVAKRGVVALEWALPEGVEMSDIKSFTIYRNGEEIASTTEPTYVDNIDSDETQFEYFVDAVYKSGLISPYVSTSVAIPHNYIADLTGEVVEGTENDIVNLNWKLNTMLTRMNDKEQYTVGEYNAASVDYVHRFTAEDLRIYKGYKIRKVGFLPYQGPQVVSLTIRVWEADEDGSNPRIVSERVVKEFGNAVWNDILLTKQVTIADQKQLWIGLHYESNNGYIQLLDDRGGNGNGLGNWIKIGDGEWGQDEVSTGNYYLRFTLSAPTTVEAPVVLETPGAIENVATDLTYPAGFSVYRDDVLLGMVQNCSFVDDKPLAGTHTYSVANIYKGSNESVVKSIELTIANGGVANVTAEVMPMIVNGKMVKIAGGNGTAIIANAMGQVVFNGEVRGDINLTPGFYIIKSGKATQKIIVR